jgi:uncharacterized membrane protein YkvI
VAAAALATFIAMMFDLDGLMAINSKLAPVLAIGGLLVGLVSFLDRAAPALALPPNHSWIASAVIYASYNIVTAIPVLAAMGKALGQPKTARDASLMGGGLMTILGIFMLYPIYAHYAQASQSEVPLLAIAAKHSFMFEQFYLVIMLCAIFTTAISNGFAIAAWASERLGVKPLAAKAAISISSCLAAHIGFSMFVARVYPLFSAIGMLELAAILAAWKRGRKAALPGKPAKAAA